MLGWLVQWTSGTSTTKLVMEGLMSQLQMTPSSFQVTSTGDTNTGIQSALWVGQSGVVQVTTVTQFAVNKLYFTTSVKMQNKGTSTITNVYCKFSAL